MQLKIQQAAAEKRHLQQDQQGRTCNKVGLGI
jgi:hypothetical protein